MTKSSKVFPALRCLFALLGTAAAALTVFLAFSRLNAPPVILKAPGASADCTQQLMEHVCQGNYDRVSELLYGSPNLELDREPADPVGALLREAYVDSASYEFLGECYPTETGLARDVRFVCLDLTSVTQALGEHAQDIFRQRLDSAEDTSAIYDENNNYRQEFIQEVMCDATRQALAENARSTQTELTLQLAYYRGQWLVTPDSAFMSTILGGIAG